ncbi:MAG: dipeptidase [Candidatus Kapaibacterium sp.]|jgi:acetylornithine deacetylase/succinyl-diaminopimelate desuccinylase-like protein
MEGLSEFIESQKERYETELKEFLRIPSISTAPEHEGDMRKCAEFVRDELARIGMSNAAIFETARHPVVYAESLTAGPSAPTVLFYGHYDVQPVDPLNLWDAPPFEPTIRGDNIYARGSADDKGQVFLNLKALEAHMKIRGKLPVNVKVMIEGEEEIGSPNLEKFMQDHKEMLACDTVLVSDTPMYGYDMPSLCYGLRGLFYVQLEVTGPNRDLHSGSYGGMVQNPINALAGMIAQMKDASGHILIDGIYDSVVDASSEERAEFARLPFSESKTIADLGVNALVGEEGYTNSERLWIRPTLDVNGIWGGFQGDGAKTVLPSKAYAKISMRLVPNQTPEEVTRLFTAFVQKITPPGVTVKIISEHGGLPAVTPIDSAGVRAARKALFQVYGKEPFLTREGGSIPIVVSFLNILNAPTVLMGFTMPDQNAHSPNEKLNLPNFHRGIKTVALFYDEMAKG